MIDDFAFPGRRLVAKAVTREGATFQNISNVGASPTARLTPAIIRIIASGYRVNERLTGLREPIGQAATFELYLKVLTNGSSAFLWSTYETKSKEAMTDSGLFGSPQSVKERRTSEREKTFLLAKITYNGGACSFDCTIRDISESGARVEIPAGQTLPKHVYLIDIRGGVAYASEVRWRAESQLGVLFTGVFSLNGQLPEEARFLKRLWAGTFRGANSDAMAITRADVPTEHSPETANPPIRQAAAGPEVSPEMIGAGIAAYAAWKSGEFAWLHSEHDMVRAVFLAMFRAMRNGR